MNRITGIMALILMTAVCGRAADGTWIAGYQTHWLNTDAWEDGNIAEGADSTAYFVGSGAVNLSDTITIGHLHTDTEQLTHSLYDYGGSLTLATSSGAPTVTTITRSAFRGGLAGTQGFIKLGSSLLNLDGAAMTPGVGSFEIAASGVNG